MPLTRLQRPSPSMAVSVAALVVALGGTSYAAATIGTSDLERNAVTSSKVKNDNLRSVDIKNGTLGAQDLRPGLLDPRSDPEAFTRWALVNRDGEIEAQSGGFEIVAAYPVLPNTAPEGQPDNSLRANGNVYIDANEDLSDNGIVATVVLQNTVDQDGGGMAGRTPGSDANAEFSGEIAVSRCNTGDPTTPPSGPTNCAPAGARNAQGFAVSPRMSDGSVTTDETTSPDAPDTRKAFYVIITGDSSDFGG